MDEPAWTPITDFFGLTDTINDPFGDVAAAQKQYDAQVLALEQQKALAEQAQATFLAQSEKGTGYTQAGAELGAASILTGGNDAQHILHSGYGQGSNQLASGFEQGIGSAQQGYTQGRGDMAGGFGQARSDLGNVTSLGGRYERGATGAIDSYDALGQRQDRLGAMLDQPGGMYGGFQEDPGYKFRQQQGEQAILRQASAGGGRQSGATMKALADYNQGLASQEFGNYANRQQAAAGIASGSDAAQSALLQNQAGRSDQARLQAQQNQYGLTGMGYGAYGQQAGYAAQGGQALGNMANDYGGQMAGYQIDAGRGQSDLSTQLAQQQAGVAGSMGSQLGNLYSNAGVNMGNIAIGVGGNAQNNANSLMGAYQNFAQYGGMQEQANANQKKETAALIASFFSDSRLKTEIETMPDSPFERIGLRGVRWKWNATANRLGLFGKNEGVIAQEVLELYPHAVVEREGFLAVDYAELVRRIGAQAAVPVVG